MNLCAETFAPGSAAAAAVDALAANAKSSAARSATSDLGAGRLIGATASRQTMHDERTCSGGRTRPGPRGVGASGVFGDVPAGVSRRADWRDGHVAPDDGHAGRDDRVRGGR